MHLYYNRKLTVCGPCDHSGNLYGPTLVYLHTDGAECLPIALQDVSPYSTNGILLAKIYHTL